MGSGQGPQEALGSVAVTSSPAIARYLHQARLLLAGYCSVFAPGQARLVVLCLVPIAVALELWDLHGIHLILAIAHRLHTADQKLFV